MGNAGALASNWTDLGAVIKTSTVGAVVITLALPFDTSDYATQIDILAGANVTILGQGAVLDAARKGRFFYVPASASLALDSLTLQRGFPKGGWPGDKGFAYGGALFNAGQLSVDNSNFMSNLAGDTSQATGVREELDWFLLTPWCAAMMQLLCGKPGCCLIIGIGGGCVQHRKSLSRQLELHEKPSCCFGGK